MLGLPTETEDDVRAIAELCEKVAERYYDIPKERRIGKCQITASSSFFVPKPFTPFQWAAMNTKEEFLAKAHLLKESVRSQKNQKSLKYNYHEADISVLEGVLARGDRRLAPVIESAYRNGALFDAWSETFQPECWEQAFLAARVNPDFYTSRERGAEELFPWDFISAGVSKEFLKREWETAKKEKVTPNCRQKCSGCGARTYGGGVCHEAAN